MSSINVYNQIWFLVSAALLPSSNMGDGGRQKGEGQLVEGRVGGTARRLGGGEISAWEVMEWWGRDTSTQQE